MMSGLFYKMLWMRINIGLNSDKLASYQTQPTYRSCNIGHLKNIYTWSNFWWRQISQVCPNTQAAYFMRGGEILIQQNISFRPSQRRSVTVHKMRIETLTFWVSVQIPNPLTYRASLKSRKLSCFTLGAKNSMALVNSHFQNVTTHKKLSRKT